jgi:pimeloyl-ACP methyl ester carboxylesterase
MPATRPRRPLSLLIPGHTQYCTHRHRIFPTLDRKLFFWQIGRFIRDDDVRKEVVPALFNDFLASRPAFLRLNEDLLYTLRDRRKMIPAMKLFTRPVHIIFGDSDPYLNKGVAKSLHELFPASELILIRGARHYVQIDEPEEVARLILQATELKSAA